MILSIASCDSNQVKSLSKKKANETFHLSRKIYWWWC